MKLKGREKAFPYSMLFRELKEDFAFAQRPVVSNECSCLAPGGIKSNFFNYWKTRCDECNTIFDETKMKRIERQRIILESKFEKMEFYKCKDEDCENMYLRQKGKCPITDCKTSHPQRISRSFVKTGRMEVNSSDDANENLLRSDEDGYCQIENSEKFRNFIKEMILKHPWSLILAINLYEYRLSGGNLLSNPELFQSILECKWNPSDMEWFNNMLAFTVGDEKKYDIPIKDIRKNLLTCKIELKGRGVDTTGNSTEIKLKIGELADLFREILLRHLS